MKNWITNIFLGLNFLMYLVVVGLWISVPEEVTLNLFTTIASFLITSGLILTNREKFSVFYKSLFFKKLVANLVTIILVFVILGFINFLSFKNPVVWDVTKNKTNSLTPQTHSLLNSIEGEVKVRIFSLKKNYELVKSLVDLYRLKKNDISIEFIDAELSPQIIRQAGVTKIPAIEFLYKGKRKVVSNLSELEITNALIKVSREDEPTIYFVDGHGELDLSSEDNNGGLHLSSLLQSNTLSLRRLNLRQAKSIPSDASVVVLWGSKNGFFPGEIEVLRAYWEKGGKLLVALDPDFNGDGQTELKGILKEFGLQINNDLIIDRLKNANGSNGTVPIIHKFDPNHPLTKDFNESVFFPLATSVEVVENHENNKSWHVLARSNHFPASWGETSRKELSSLKLSYTEGEDLKGPRGYFAVFEKNGQRALVFGNSTFVSNNYKKFPKNFVLFLNAINWMIGEDRLVAFNVPVIEDRPIFMSTNQVGVIFYFTVVFCPLVLGILAFVFYRRRQKL